MKTYLREVNKNDCKLLFQWANEESVRKNSFNSNEIKYEEHEKWLENKLNSANCYIYIFCLNNLPVGQIRLDIENTIGVVSYSLDKDYRGQNLSVNMINLLENEVIQSNIAIERLIGYVKVSNIASQKIFESLKYDKVLNNDVIKYYKYINEVVLTHE